MDEYGNPCQLSDGGNRHEEGQFVIVAWVLLMFLMPVTKIPTTQALDRRYPVVPNTFVLD